MRSPNAANRAADHVASAHRAASSLAQGGVDINPDTGLCTDYLNHFNEAIMVLEMLFAVPEVIDEFLAWKPRNYLEHFAVSNFKNRAAVLAAYQGADPATREALDALADTMNAMLSATRDVIRTGNSASAAAALAKNAVTRLKPLVARAGMVINGRMAERKNNTEAGTPQAAVDALLQR